jgi:hypothetical protein
MMALLKARTTFKEMLPFNLITYFLGICLLTFFSFSLFFIRFSHSFFPTCIIPILN